MAPYRSQLSNRFLRPALAHMAVRLLQASLRCKWPAGQVVMRQPADPNPSGSCVDEGRCRRMMYGRRLQVIHRKEPMAWKGQRTVSSGKNWWLVWACVSAPRGVDESISERSDPPHLNQRVYPVRRVLATSYGNRQVAGRLQIYLQPARAPDRATERSRARGCLTLLSTAHRGVPLASKKVQSTAI